MQLIKNIIHYIILPLFDSNRIIINRYPELKLWMIFISEYFYTA